MNVSLGWAISATGCGCRFWWEVVVEVDGCGVEDVDEDAIYGFKITNTAPLPLYMSMFYFDVSDLSISTPSF